MTKQTTDYSIFKIHPGNREIDSANIKKLTTSIKARNLLHLQPIIVNESMEVIDGQHRLKVAELLGIPIHYDVHKDYKSSDIAALNVHKSWDKEDVLNFYASEGLPDYIEFKTYMKKYGLTFSLASAVFRTFDKDESINFKLGKYKFPTGEKLMAALEFLSNLEAVKELIIPKLPGKKTFVYSNRFGVGLRSFLSIRSVIFSTFLHKLEQRLDLVRPCYNTASTVAMFKQIYNWKNVNKILSEEDLIIEEN